jgi:hypothetical protein
LGFEALIVPHIFIKIWYELLERARNSGSGHLRAMA